MSNNLTLSRNYSREASHHEFKAEQGSIIIGNNQPYGKANINQTAKGVDYPNTQAAIDDLASMFTLPVNSVVINTDGVNPQGVAQIDQFTFTGTATDADRANGDLVLFNFYGTMVEIAIGDTNEEIANKVRFALELKAANADVYSIISQGATQDIIQVVYVDVQPHVLEPISNFGVKVEQVKVSPAKPGYGVWSQIGTQTLTLDGATSPTTFYYFKRDA